MTTDDDIERQIDLYAAGAFMSGMVSAIVPPLAILGVPAMIACLKEVDDAVQSRKLAAILRIAETITHAFGADVELTPQVPIEGTKEVDLFVRFPKAKISFLFAVRATGAGVAFYNEQSETVCFQRRRGTTRYNNPEIIALLKLQDAWLRKNRRDLFGGTGTGARTPIYRALIFASPARVRTHSEHLYTTISAQRFVSVYSSSGSVYLLQEDGVIAFIENYLLKVAKSKSE